MFEEQIKTIFGPNYFHLGPLSGLCYLLVIFVAILCRLLWFSLSRGFFSVIFFGWSTFWLFFIPFFCIFRLLTIHIYEHFSMVNFFRSSCMKTSSCGVPNYKLFSVEAVWKFRQVLLLAMNYFSSKLYENSVKWCSWLWTIFRPSWMNVPSRKIFSVQKQFCLKGTVPRDWFWPLDDDTTTVS